MSTPNAKVEAPRPGRTRRRAAKAVDYSKEQQFSDDDIFEDEAQNKSTRNVPTPVPTGRRGRPPGRPRKSNTPNFELGSVGNQQTGASVGYGDYMQGNAPRYAEKGYDMTLPPIRDRYLFEPEFELDGSSKIELIIGRRPIQENKNNTDFGHGDEDKDDADLSSSEDESQKEVETSPKVKRKRGRPRKNPSPERKPKKETVPLVLKKHVEYEYLLKYKGKSYLHLEWKSGSELDSMNKSAKTLHRRFLKKLKAGNEENLEDPTFDDACVTVQKIVDEKDQIRSVELTDKELMAWERKREREMAEEMSLTEDEKPETIDSPEKNPKEEEKMNNTIPREDNGEEKKAVDDNGKDCSSWDKMFH